MHDEWRLHSLPIARQPRRIRRRVRGPLAARERIKFCVRFKKLSGFRVDSAHLDSRPEAAECEPRISLSIKDQIWIYCVVVVLEPRLQDQPAVFPVEVGTVWIKSFVGQQCN